MKSLYELTGDIKDFNTVLVNRAELQAMSEAAGRYQWLKKQKALELTSAGGGSLWIRPDGSKFFASHRLAAGNTQFSPQETLDATIDCARAVQAARNKENV